jgi:hypothetical protein
VYAKPGDRLFYSKQTTQKDLIALKVRTNKSICLHAPDSLLKQTFIDGVRSAMFYLLREEIGRYSLDLNLNTEDPDCPSSDSDYTPGKVLKDVISKSEEEVTTIFSADKNKESSARK